MHKSFYLMRNVKNSSKSQPTIWATFLRKFVAKNFKNSPNLVTLYGSRDVVGGQVVRVLAVYSYTRFLLL